jgi:hypothetical protein
MELQHGGNVPYMNDRVQSWCLIVTRKFKMAASAGQNFNLDPNGK